MKGIIHKESGHCMLLTDDGKLPVFLNYIGDYKDCDVVEFYKVDVFGMRDDNTNNAYARIMFRHDKEYTEDLGLKGVVITLDRQRDIVYNGEELIANTYQCSSCKEDYIFEQINHSFCPFCGTEYKFKADVSI